MLSFELIQKNLAFLTAFCVPLISFVLYKLYPYINPLRLPLRRTNHHGGELVASVLKAHGVKYVFTLVGGHISPILVAAKKEGIRVIDVRSECTTVFAADAVSRLSGTPGVAIVTAGPGVCPSLLVHSSYTLQSILSLIMCSIHSLPYLQSLKVTNTITVEFGHFVFITYSLPPFAPYLCTNKYNDNLRP